MTVMATIRWASRWPNVLPLRVTRHERCARHCSTAGNDRNPWMAEGEPCPRVAHRWSRILAASASPPPLAALGLLVDKVLALLDAILELYDAVVGRGHNGQ